MRLGPAILALVMLAACSQARDITDLRAFVRDADKGLPRRIDPLPAFPAKGEPARYNAANLPDPFNPGGASAARGV